MGGKPPCTKGTTSGGLGFPRGMDESADECPGLSGTSPPGAASPHIPGLWTGTGPNPARRQLAGTVTTQTRSSTKWCGWALNRL